MEYRKFPRGTEQISILGLGTSAIGQAGENEIEATALLALEHGVNYFDMASADAAPFPAFGRAVAGDRKCIFSNPFRCGLSHGNVWLDVNYRGGQTFCGLAA